VIFLTISRIKFGKEVKKNNVHVGMCATMLAQIISTFQFQSLSPIWLWRLLNLILTTWLAHLFISPKWRVPNLYFEFYFEDLWVSLELIKVLVEVRVLICAPTRSLVEPRSLVGLGKEEKPKWFTTMLNHKLQFKSASFTKVWITCHFDKSWGLQFCGILTLWSNPLEGLFFSY